MEIPAPRANHVQVYINNDYYGLYISVEHIDEEFIKSRFTYNDGNQYKCLWPANLNYIGENPDLYKLEMGDRRVYELKINEELGFKVEGILRDEILFDGIPHDVLRMGLLNKEI